MEIHPRISVVIPTYNRPDDVRRALNSLAAVEYPCWEILIVDQSNDARTQEVVQDFSRALPNLRYRRLPEVGCSLGRNVGIEETDGEIIAFLDDDCAVAPDWLVQVALAFGRHPHAELVLGELRRFDGLAEWAADGWIPIRHFSEEFEANVIGSMRQRFRMWSALMGNGACMFVRRSLVPRIGFFNLQLGGGADFPANEDGDYIYRAYMSGCTIVGTPAIIADHYGLRDYESGAAQRLLRAYQYSIGGWFMKVLRMGDPFALIWILKEYWRALRVIRFRNILSLHGPTGLINAAALTNGFVHGVSLRFNRKNKVFDPGTAQ